MIIDDIKKDNSANNGGFGFDIENDKNILQGGEDSSAFVEKEKTDTQRQEAAAFAQGADNSAQASSDTQDLSGNVDEPAKYTMTYTPPYYVPSFAVSSADITDTSDNTAKKYTFNQKAKVASIAMLCAACFLLVTCIVVFAAVLLSKNLLSSGFFIGDSKIDILIGNKEVNIVDGGNKDSYSVPQIVEMVADSVVEITTKQVTHNSFFGNYVTGGAGSGVVFAQEGNTGYIVTNYHVVADADEIVVTAKIAGEQKQYEASYVSGDDGKDIAVLTVRLNNGEQLCTATFRDLENSPLQVGESVLAIGNPLGQLGGTVTNGIISALDREIVIDGNKMVLLQTNAAVNPGNSGGGLFDSFGMLVGIVNAKQSETGIEGLGFAIPADEVLADITDILEKGYITGRVSLGIQVYAMKDIQGVYVLETSDEFKANDRIVAINGAAIETLADYNAALGELTIGETVTVVVWRKNSYANIEVKIIEDKSKS